MPNVERMPEILIDNQVGITADQNAVIAANGALRCYGYSCRESAATAAAATFRLVHSDVATGTTIIEVVELAANESRSEVWPIGIPCPNGISIDWIAGTVDVHIRYAYIS